MVGMCVIDALLQHWLRIVLWEHQFGYTSPPMLTLSIRKGMWQSYSVHPALYCLWANSGAWDLSRTDQDWGPKKSSLICMDFLFPPCTLVRKYKGAWGKTWLVLFIIHLQRRQKQPISKTQHSFWKQQWNISYDGSETFLWRNDDDAISNLMMRNNQKEPFSEKMSTNKSAGAVCM